MFDITCVIFAGGRSSRMGQDKSLLPFGNYSSLTEYQLERLSKLFKRICISSKEADKFDFEADVIPDMVETGIYAPTAGFVSVFEHLSDERIFVLSVDTPFVEEKQIVKLLERDEAGVDAVIAKTFTGTHPMCGIYHRRLLGSFKKMLEEDNHRLGQLLKNSETIFVPFAEEEAFANLNHPEEYEAALKRMT